MTNQIIVQLNPDVPPTGSDLGIVNAARKSFGRRSEWEYVHPDGTIWNTVEEIQSYYQIDDDGVQTWVTRQLKDKDKRLLEFLARGMTAADFDEFLKVVAEAGSDVSGGWQDEEEILSKLLWQWRNTPTHDTPFNHGFFSFEVKAPIFVARHLVKHEYLIMSEYSRRYITDDVEFYTPEVWRKAAADVKQGSSDEAVTRLQVGEDLSYDLQGIVGMKVESMQILYKQLILSGVAPEQARMVLPQSLMTSWTWSGTLGAFANMCKLRLSSDTQAETRVVAQAVYEELKKQFPVAAPLLVEGVL
jgi:thymidylate synthase (FAD)